MINTTPAYNQLTNMSIIKSSTVVYEAVFGIWLWPILFWFTLVLLYIKTENPAYVTIYAILGNVALGTTLPTILHPVFYMSMVFSLTMVLWSIWGSKRTE